jgi:TPR repeat protein
LQHEKAPIREEFTSSQQNFVTFGMQFWPVNQELFVRLKHYRPYCYINYLNESCAIRWNSFQQLLIILQQLLIYVRSAAAGVVLFGAASVFCGPTAAQTPPAASDISPAIAEALRNGGAALNRKDYAEALRWLGPAADQGNANAQYGLAVMYANGYGVAVDYPRAIDWLRKAANQGNADAQYLIGFMYDGGVGVTRDDGQAIAWYRKSAEQGHADAQFQLGRHYFGGHGVPKDYQQAMFWFGKAAGQGNPGAENGLAILYLGGFGTPKNIAEAVKWYRKAAEDGIADAQVMLGDAYAEGLWGVPQDENEARRWWGKAADQGNAKAKEHLAAAEKRMHTAAAPTGAPDHDTTQASAGLSLLSWQVEDEKDKITNKTTHTAISSGTFGDGVSLDVRAICDGMGVEFVFETYRGQAPAAFAWDHDKLPMRIRIDGQVRVAGGQSKYSNQAAIEFYDPAAAQKVLVGNWPSPQDNQNSVGVLFNRLMGKSALLALPSIAAGKLNELNNAQSVLVELPFAGGSSNVVDLNPRDAMLKTIIRKCMADIGAKD